VESSENVGQTHRTARVGLDSRREGGAASRRAESAPTADATDSLRPASERVLGKLPGPRVLWIAAWSLVPWLNAGANLLLGSEGTSAVWEQSTVLIVLNYAALSLAVVISLWGSGRIARKVQALRTDTSNVLGRDSRIRFRGMDSVAGPLVSSIVISIVFAGTALARDGWAAALLRGATWFVLGIALWTFLWTYASLQLGLSRLGREHLRPDAIHVDPALGLRPLGDVAFTGLWMLLVWLVPVVLTALPDIAGASVGLLVLLTGLAAFFLSLRGLHRQMVEVKAAEVAIARDLYARAYEPLRGEPTLELLERQQGLLRAADALDKRARELHEWPIDERTFARVATITTSVIAMIVGRLILDPLGL
jgi:hypothetical protein